jgi:hypothetical protein
VATAACADGDCGNEAGAAASVAQQAAPQIRGLLTEDKTQLHHLFPQSFRTWFGNRGIEIDKYTIPLERSTHLAGIHGRGGFVGPGNVMLPGRWNALWRTFIQQNPNATAEEVYKHAGELMDQFGLNHLPIVPYK